MQQSPSQGRIVHVVWSGMIYVGLVAFVHSPMCINVALFDQQGNHAGGHTSVMYNEDRLTHLTWSWPPFVPAPKKEGE